MLPGLSLRIFPNFQNQVAEGLQWYHCIEAVSVSDSSATELSRYTVISLELIQVARSNYIHG